MCNKLELNQGIVEELQKAINLIVTMRQSESLWELDGKAIHAAFQRLQSIPEIEKMKRRIYRPHVAEFYLLRAFTQLSAIAIGGTIFPFVFEEVYRDLNTALEYLQLNIQVEDQL